MGRLPGTYLDTFKKHGENHKFGVKIKDPHFEYGSKRQILCGSITLMFGVLLNPAEIKWPALKP
jgi:hypothetical protein